MKYTLFIWLLIAQVFMSCTGTQSFKGKDWGGKTSLQYYRSALRDFESGRMDSARIKLELARKIKPDYAPYYFLLGKIHLINKEPDQAKQYFIDALELKSFYPEVWQDLANIYFRESRFDKAAFYFRKLSEALPQKEFYVFQLIRCSNRDGKPEAALLQLKEFKQKKLYFDGLYFELAMAYRSLKQMNNAAEAFQKYYKIHKDNPGEEELLFGASLYEAMTQYETMLSLANQGLQLFPSNPLWYYYRLVYFSEKQNKKAEKFEFEKLLDLLNNDVHLTFKTVKFFCSMGKNITAHKIFESISQVDSLENSELRELSHTCISDDDKIKILNVLFERTGDKKIKNQLKKLSGE